MIERVRAIVLDPRQHHARPQAHPARRGAVLGTSGRPTDETDNSLEDALRRELREELGGDATILRLVDVIHRETERQYFYLATMDRWSFARQNRARVQRTRARHIELEEIPSHADDVEAIDLKPDEIAEFLTNALRGTGGLAALPDLREMGWAR